MKKVFWLYYRQNLIYAGLAFLSTLLLTIAFYEILNGPKLSTVYFVTALAVLMIFSSMVFQLLQPNIRWLMTLPFSKIRLYFFNYSLKLISFLTVFILIFIAGLFVSLVTQNTEIISLFKESMVTSLVPYFTGVDPSGKPAFFLGMMLFPVLVSIVHSLSVIVGFRYSEQPLLKIALGFIGFVVTTGLIIYWSESYFLTMIFGILFLFIVSNLNVLLLLTIRLRKSLPICLFNLGVFFCLIFPVFIHSMIGLNSRRADYFVNSLKTLGNLVPEPRQKVADLFMSDLRAKDTMKLAEYYDWEWGLSLDDKGFIDFKRAVTSKSSVGAAWQVLKSFSLDHLTNSHLSLTFAHIKKISKDESYGFQLSGNWELLLGMLNKGIIDNEVLLRFLSSANVLENISALGLIRSTPDRKLVFGVFENLKKYKGKVRQQAIETISVFAGRKLNYNQIKKEESELIRLPLYNVHNCRRLTKMASSTNCGRFFNKAGMNRVNYCIRRSPIEVQPETKGKIEITGWIEKVGTPTEALLAKVFGCKLRYAVKKTSSKKGVK